MKSFLRLRIIVMMTGILLIYGSSLSVKSEVRIPLCEFKQGSDPTTPVSVTATSGVASGNYLTVREAFDEINKGTHGGNIIVKISMNTTETASAVLYQSGYSGAGGTSDYSSVTLYPADAGLSITGDLAAPLIDLNGADHVTIDGRVNMGGDPDLAIVNTSTSATDGTSTIRFINGATNNNVNYATLKGASAAEAGVVFFGTDPTGGGNDNNSIAYCDIRDITDNGTDLPLTGIFSSGTAAHENSDNAVTQCNIYNFKNQGVYISANNGDNWEVTFNNFFYNNSTTLSTAENVRVIYINAPAANHVVVSNNYIGGQDVACGGGYWNYAAVSDNNSSFYGISINAGSVTASSVQGNTIQNIRLTGEIAGSVYPDPGFIGIGIENGTINVGTENGNLIGHPTLSNSIIIAGSGLECSMTGIRCNGESLTNIENNTVANLSITKNANNFQVNLTGIKSNDGNVRKNKVYDLDCALAASPGPYVRGLEISHSYYNQDFEISNNMVSIDGGGKAYGYIWGLYLEQNISVTGMNNVYFNSINISNKGHGASPLATGGYAFAFYSGYARDISFINNIFNNMVPAGNDGAVSICFWNDPVGTFGNYNLLNTVNSSIVGKRHYDVLDFPGWKSATGFDLNSANADPLFTSSSDLTPLNNSPALGIGTSISSITTDIMGNTRHAMHPTAGAFENPVGLCNPGNLAGKAVSDVAIDLSWVKTNGNNVIIACNTVNQFGTPVDGSTYLAASNLPGGDGTVIYNGELEAFRHLGLAANSLYFYKAWSYDGSVNYSTGTNAISVTTCDVPPSVQASGLNFTGIVSYSVNIGWERGDGDNCMVMVKQTNTGQASPENATTYPPNSLFGSGKQIGNSGWFCVYAGTGTSVTLTGLVPGTTYRAMVCENNGTPGTENYLTTGSTGNLLSFTTSTVDGYLFPDGPEANLVAGQTDFVSAAGGTGKLKLNDAYDISVSDYYAAVADAGNNRVLVYYYPFSSQNPVPFLVLGQPDFNSNLPNQGGSASGATLSDPTAVIINGSDIYVCDKGNNRVLKYHYFRYMWNGDECSDVLGQPDFNTVTAGTTQDKFNAPEDIYTDGTSLWVADAGNNRVLRFLNLASASSGTRADQVLGQEDYISNSPGCEAGKLNNPSGITKNGHSLYVSDQGNNRILCFENARYLGNGADASMVFGQSDLVSGSANQGGSVAANTLSAPMKLSANGNGFLFVADQGNNRVLVYEHPGEKGNGGDADAVIGQAGFGSASGSCTRTTLDAPAGIETTGTGQLLVADVNNNRVLQYRHVVDPPTVQAGNIQFNDVQRDKMTISWTRGNGAACAVFITQADNGSAEPLNGYFYEDSEWYGNYYFTYGEYIGSTGWNCLYNGTGTEVTVEDLMGGTTYRVMVLEYQGDYDSIDEVYRDAAYLFTSGSNVANQTTATNPFLWEDGMKASFVIGQPGFATAGSGTTINTLSFSSDAVVDYDNGKLYVADQLNNRVLRFAYPLTGSQPDAEMVFGQPDMLSGTPDNGGLSASSLDTPKSVALWYGTLYISDAGNNRVLVFKDAAYLNDMPEADQVFGQWDFDIDDPGTAAGNFNDPAGLAFDYSGNLFVADKGNNRVLRFDGAAYSYYDGPDANAVFGQADFNAVAPSVSVSGLDSPEDVAVNGFSLYVADKDNNRVLRFDNASFKNSGAGADAVLGQPDFTSNTQNNGGLGAASMKAPSGLDMNDGSLYVSDQGNGRTLIFRTASEKPDGAAAGRVLGKPDFSTSTCTSSASCMTGPGGISMYENTLFISDNTNNRVLQFELPKLIYVDKDAVSGLDDGTSWQNAFLSLQSAIDEAVSGNQIWVAAGTYHPVVEVNGSGSRYRTFSLKEGVTIYGGFAGTEISVEQRTDFGLDGANETILSGDLNDDDIVTGKGATLSFSGNSENCYHVIYNPPGLTTAAVLDGVTISGGNANGGGGGIFNGESSPILRNIVLTTNSASSRGGAIFNVRSSPKLLNVVINRNYCDMYGGGLSNNGPDNNTVMVNCLIEDNKAGEMGGGMFNEFYSSPVASNVTFAGNYADDNGGAIHTSDNSYPVFNNCIFGGNLSGSRGNQVYLEGNYNDNTVTTLNNCCYPDGPNDMVINISGSFSVANCIHGDPRFMNPGISNYLICGNSPCADAGNDSYNSETTDIRRSGFARKLDKTTGAAGTIDIGAYEYQYGSDPAGAIIYVDAARPDDSDDGLSWANAKKTLQAALDQAIPPDTIWVKAGTYNPTAEVGGSGSRYRAFSMKEGVGIYGGFAGNETALSQRNIAANETILSGDLNGDDDYAATPWTNISENTYHVIYNPDGLNLTASAILDGFTVSGGNANGSSPREYFGGGIESYNNSGTYRNLKVIHNRAPGWYNNATGGGGGIYFYQGNQNMLNTIIEHNISGQRGGGLYIENGWLQMTNCEVKFNEALYGGGLSIVSRDNTVMTNTTIAMNSASQGGGIYLFGCSPQMKNSILWGNTSSSSQGHQVCGVLSCSIILYRTCYSLNPGDYELMGGLSINDNCITADPRFVDAAGGELRIFDTSPCTDAGNDSYNTEDFDVRGTGFVRKLLKTSRTTVGPIDMGAYEYQQGFDPVCTNPTSGGVIAAAQTVCTGSVPDTLTSVTLPAGHTGSPGYQWQQSTAGSDTGFMDIAGADSTIYIPGALTQTTWFKRLARVTCMGDWTGAAASNVLKITVEQTSVTGTLAKTPDVTNVCEGSNVSAALTAGSGGNGSDSLAYRTHNGTSWSSWANYTSGTNISTTGKTQVEIHTLRKADYCSNAAPTTVSWVVEQTPVTGTLAKTPDVNNVCEGSNVSAALTAGSGGNGSDSLAYRTHNGTAWSSWANYTTGTNISTTGKTQVEIHTLRKADYCSNATASTVSWTVEQTPVTGTLAKTPVNDTVCEGTKVLADFIPGSGGNGLDSLQYRLMTGSSWSAWMDYSSGDTIPSAGRVQVEVRTWRNTGYCADAQPSVVTWKISAVPAAGQATGGTSVCYGSGSVLLTLENYVGSVNRWQRSPDQASWSNIPSSASATYTATNDTAATWYRAVVTSGVCAAEQFSGATQITISGLFTISGIVRYENNPKTPLSGLKITLNKTGTNNSWSMNTSVSGMYSFSGLTNGLYHISITSAAAGGNWQTWGGVNMTDYLLTYKHATTGPPLPALPPVVRISGDVKAPQSPPLINSMDASAIQMAAKYGWGNPPFFQIPKWVFSGLTGTTDTIPLNCANVSFDLRGLCAGDVNGSYLPGSGYKTARPGLALENRGMIPVTEEMIFPVHADREMEPGAITLFINYDPSSIEITGVTIPGNTGNEPCFEVNEGVLFIGWISTESLPAEENQPLLMIRARLAGATDLIRFTLNDNPLSELADAEGNVIQNLKLFIPDAGSSVNDCGLLPVALYPNPAQDDLMVEMAAPADGTVTLELVTLQGVSQMKQNTFVQAGWNKITLNMQNLSNGTYLLKVITGERTEVRKVIVNR